MAGRKKDNDSLLDSLRNLTEQIAGGTLDFARSTATMTAMFGEAWLRNALLTKLEPERLEAMADAGHFLRDARETAGMSLKELSERLGLTDRGVLEDIESGETIMPLELMLRCAALLARHDPIPFLIKFMRTYNPALENALEQWGVLALPRQYERERRFVNLVRQHDMLRRLSDTEYDRFIHYMESASNLVLDVMRKEKKADGSKEATASAVTDTPRLKRQPRPAAKKRAGARKRVPGGRRHSPS